MTRPTQKRPGIFVTGTDSGVGKTIVTAAVVTAFRAQGVEAGVMKPIATGLAECTAGLSDPEWLVSATGLGDSPAPLAPYRFQISAAPLVAASRTGTTIDLDRITHSFQALLSNFDCVVVEGIGGVMVPLTRLHYVVDLINRMGLPALVVARTGLGSINHTLLTLDCLRSRGVPILGLVFNNPTHPPSTPDESETIPTILRLSETRSFGELPHCEGLPASWEKHRDTLIAKLDVQNLLEGLGLRGVA